MLDPGARCAILLSTGFHAAGPVIRRRERDRSTGGERRLEETWG
jgi:hypothetical protein